jgi:hypothetical protein
MYTNNSGQIEEEQRRFSSSGQPLDDAEKWRLNDRINELSLYLVTCTRTPENMHKQIYKC